MSDPAHTTQRPLLIGLTGNAGAGKDTVAQVLASAGWQSIAFADALRWEVASSWRIDPRLLTDRATKEQPLACLCVGQVHDADWLRWCAVQGHNLMTPRSPRWAQQQWGSWRRAGDPHYWVRHVQMWVRTQQRRGAAGLVVTDVRFPNEAAAIQALGGHIVRVHRPGLPGLPADTARHESEQHTALPAAADIANDSTLPALHHEVWRVVSLLQDRPPQPTTDAT